MPPKLHDLFQLDHEIGQLKKLLHEKEVERECTLAGILSAKVTKQRGYELVKNTKTRRIPNVAQFFKRFPSVVDQIADIRLKEADEALGVNVVNSLCEIKPVISYRVIEMGEREDASENV